MSKNYHVIINSQADHAMYAHIKFLSQVSLPAADRLKKALISKIRSLQDNPYEYPAFESAMALHEYRKIVIDRYIILYEIVEKEKTVSVKFIWDARMDNAL
jgi:plasmid stabilization system protein ParE